MSTENSGGKLVAAIKVVIVGAGISGIAAARRLVRLGFHDLTILEASHRIGGRIHTTSLGDGWVETGAQWIHGETDNVVHEYATKHGLICDDDRLSTYELNNVHFYTSDGLRMDDTLCESAFEQMSTVLEDIKSRKSTNSNDDIKNLASHLEEGVSKEVERRRRAGASEHEHQLRIGLLDWFNKYQCSVDGCDSLAELSPTSFSHYRECDGNQLTNLKNGYSSIVQSAAKDAGLIDASNILYGKCVNRIETSLPTKTRIRLTCDDGTQYEADHVVLTVSLGVLKHSVDTMFEPPLSAAKRQAILGIGFGTVNKILIEFARPFWSSNSSGYNLVWMDRDTEQKDPSSSSTNCSWCKDLFGFYTVPFASNILCGWVSGKGARQMETLADDSEVLKVCLDLLRRFTGKADLPKVVNFLRTGWNSNPYTRGSYSYLNSGLSEPKLANDVLAEPICVKKENGQMCPALLFAGEATHSYYYSTVHGAWETGEREANRIADFHRLFPPTSRLHNLPAKL